MSERVLELADGLYALPWGEFTPARDALAKQHRADRELAAAVKGLRKPTLAAWVVNLLVRRDAEQVEQVLGVGAALRAAQATLDAGQLRELTRQRRQLTSAVTGRARALAADEGQRVTESVAEQVEATLTAAMVDEGAEQAVRSGLLVTALAATGVDAVDVASAVALPEALGFTPRPGGPAPPTAPELHVVPDPDAEAKARAAAEEALAEAEAALGESESTAAEAQERVAVLQARTLELQSELDELRRRVAGLEDDQEELDEELAEAEAEAEEAGAAVGAARADRDRARRAVERLGSGG